jgi:hypothetical protein
MPGPWRIVSAIGGEEDAPGNDENKPADRVARLAPGVLRLGYVPQQGIR